MRRLRAFLTALGVALLMCGVSATAHAQTNDDVYTRYDQNVVLAENGTATVTVDADLDFGNTPGHGPLLTFITAQKMADGRYRLLDTKFVSVTSSTRANTDVQTQSEYTSFGVRTTLGVRIGAEGRTYTGVQNYRFVFTIEGLVTPDQAQSGMDEFNWNSLGAAGSIPHVNPTVTVTGPGAAVQQAACFSGVDLTEPCEATFEGGTARYAVNGTLDGTESMQVVTGFPVGSFKNAEPRYVTPPTLESMFPLSPANIGGAAAIGGLGIGGVLLLARRRRDRAFSGVAPGTVPASLTAPVGVRQEGTIAVRFTPPTGARPAEASYLQHASTNKGLISATVIDLAARGYLRVEQDGKKDWSYIQLRTPGPELVDYEATILETLFQHGPTVTTDDLRRKSYSDLATQPASQLSRRVRKELRWFNGNPMLARAGAVAAGVLLIVVGLIAAGVLGLVGLGFWGLGLVAAGVGFIAVSKRMTQRTPVGTAVLAQTEGFEKYLSTAEADQIRWEEGQDIFSRYLPWAMVFGVSERWIKMFRELAEQGRYDPSLAGWYYSPYQPIFYGNALESLGSSFTSAMSAATAAANSGSGGGSSGFSGFSGGGGFGGGGSGSW